MLFGYKTTITVKSLVPMIFWIGMIIGFLLNKIKHDIIIHPKSKNPGKTKESDGLPHRFHIF